MSKIVEGLKYSESHEWVKVEDGVALVGVSDFAQKEMGDITYVDMPDVDDEVTAGEEFGALESVKAASDLISPVSGKVVAVNEELDEAPEKVNEDAYENWIIKVEMSDPSELDDLMDAEVRTPMSSRCWTGSASRRWKTSMRTFRRNSSRKAPTPFPMRCPSRKSVRG